MKEFIVSNSRPNTTINRVEINDDMEAIIVSGTWQPILGEFDSLEEAVDFGLQTMVGHCFTVYSRSSLNCVFESPFTMLSFKVIKMIRSHVNGDWRKAFA